MKIQTKNNIFDTDDKESGHFKYDEYCYKTLYAESGQENDMPEWAFLSKNDYVKSLHDTKLIIELIAKDKGRNFNVDFSKFLDEDEVSSFAIHILAALNEYYWKHKDEKDSVTNQNIYDDFLKSGLTADQIKAKYDLSDYKFNQIIKREKAREELQQIAGMERAL